MTPLKTAQILRELREARHLSQDETARALGIDRTTYVKYERGGSIKRNLPKLADFFHVSTDYLLGRSENITYRPTQHKVASTTFDPILATYSTENIKHSLPYSKHEASLVNKYRDLKPEHQKAVDIQIDYFHSIDATPDPDTPWFHDSPACLPDGYFFNFLCY